MGGEESNRTLKKKWERLEFGMDGEKSRHWHAYPIIILAWSNTGRRMGYMYCSYHGISIIYLPAAVATAVAETGIEFRWFGRITTTRRTMYVIQVPTDVGYDHLWCIPKSQVNSTRSYGAAVGNSRRNRPAKRHVNCECESESWDASSQYACIPWKHLGTRLGTLVKNYSFIRW